LSSARAWPRRSGPLATTSARSRRQRLFPESRSESESVGTVLRNPEYAASLGDHRTRGTRSSQGPTGPDGSSTEIEISRPPQTMAHAVADGVDLRHHARAIWPQLPPPAVVREPICWALLVQTNHVRGVGPAVEHTQCRIAVAPDTRAFCSISILQRHCGRLGMQQ
jgi:hypothetical protein